MTVKSIETRFRAYRLETSGSSFSYFDGTSFTLIEARYTDENKASIAAELKACNRTTISTLHITSWDQDHCSPSQLTDILTKLKPNKIEYPGYEPHTDSGKESLKLIQNYKPSHIVTPTLIAVTPKYIDSLSKAKSYGYRDVMYHPKVIDSDSSNNNSTIKQFRTGSFNVLSLGDVESANISSMIRSSRTVYEEVDVLIMAHHGADNGFTTSGFIRKVKPSLAVASSNYGNQFDHPKPNIRELLKKHEVQLFTTKMGDVIVQSVGSHSGEYEVINMKAGNTKIDSSWTGTARKNKFLVKNDDALRDRRRSHYKGPRRSRR
ncbi:MAG: hypothetical protein AseanaTS_31340 [Candidatus Pelagadaptatus aseana]|uniref:ComEC/Rec2 family competence protein n=1 Tax=Candidatus Pelagadaptatus aseana TaxID=3120508 RepID=UPI0039B1903C